MNNFCEAFAATLGRFGARTAVEVQRRDGVDSRTYAELAAMADRAAATLAAHGLRSGERCAILAENDALWCAAFLGVLRLGAVAVPLDTNYVPRQVARLLADSGARLLVASPRLQAAARQAARETSEQIPEKTTPGCIVLPLAELTEGSHPPAALPPCPAIRTDPAVILYTSGTTSDPKGVVLTHGNLLCEEKAIHSAVTLDDSDCILGVLPLYHALALVANLVLPFSIGARVVYLETLNTTELLRALEERGVSALCCVPQFFYLIYERVREQVAAAGRIRRAAFRLLLRLNFALRRMGWNAGPRLFARIHRVLGPRMHLLVTGGSRFDPAIGRELYAMGFNILQAYGLTECTGGATVTRVGDPAVDTVGQPLDSVEVRIAPREEHAEDGPADGEVMLRGPIIMQGYFNRPEATAATMRDGWLLTGDLGLLDSRGRLRITGRKKDIIVLSSGKNIYPEEIEAHYLHSPCIKEMCVMGLERPGEPVAERLHAVVVPNFDVMRERKVTNTREVLRFEIESLGVALPTNKRVLSFDVWTDDLPRTTTRKLKRFEIAARERERAAEASAAVGQQLGGQVLRALSEADAGWCALPEVAQALAAVEKAGKGKGPMHPDANIELELGLDSVERIELLAQLEQMFGTQVLDEVRQKIYTVRELVMAVLQRGAGVAAGAAEGGDAWGRLLAPGQGGGTEDDPLLQGLLEPRPVATALFYTGVKVTGWAGRVLFGFRPAGAENLPRDGPFLLCPNHQSFFDAFLLLSTLPWAAFRRILFVGASEYYATPFRRSVARALHVVPVDPDSHLVRAMQAGAFGLRHGKVLVLFPEGERTVDGDIKTFKKGAAILSLHLCAPIVPVAIRGSFDFWPRARGFRWSACLPGSGARIRLRIGPPLPPPAPLCAGCTLREAEGRYTVATESLRGAVAGMWDRL
jgi:long-chain acyl-CoA synthetase